MAWPMQTLKEAQFINKSLSFLEQTVNALARHESHVPFRQSQLTSVLRDALGGNCKVGAMHTVVRHSRLCMCRCGSG